MTGLQGEKASFQGQRCRGRSLTVALGVAVLASLRQMLCGPKARLLVAVFIVLSLVVPSLPPSGQRASAAGADARSRQSAPGGPEQPTGLPITFTASGTCSVAASTVTLTGAGSCTITAHQDGNDTYNPAQPVSQTFQIARAATTVQVAAASAQYNDSVALSATVTPASLAGQPLTGTVRFALNGSAVGSAPLDSTGSAAMSPMTITQAPGSYTITASFTSSTPNFKDSSGTGTLTVTQEDTSLTYTGDTVVTEGSPAHLAAVLTEDGATPLAQRPVTLTLGSQSCTGTTDTKGSASCTIDTVTTVPGSLSAGATYAGDTDYQGTTTSQQVKVVGPTALAYGGDTTQDYHDATTLAATLTDAVSGTPVSGVDISFTLGTQSCTGTTDSTGKATCSLTLDQAAGSATVKASFAGSDLYLPSTTSSPYTIKAEESTLSYTGDTLIVNGGTAHLSAVLMEDGTTPIQGKTVTLTLGSGTGSQTCSGTTGTDGKVGCSISPVNQPLGTQPLGASFAGDSYYLPASDTSKQALIFAYLAQGSFVVGDKSAALNSSVTYWGSQWAQVNQLSGGAAPDAFKGFTDSTSATPPTCGTSATWTSSPGNSSSPPDSVPSYMAAIVSSKVSKSGSSISGDIPEMVIIKTDAGYAGNPGHAGTGTVVAVLCSTTGTPSASMMLRRRGVAAHAGGVHRSLQAIPHSSEAGRPGSAVSKEAEHGAAWIFGTPTFNPQTKQSPARVTQRVSRGPIAHRGQRSQQRVSVHRTAGGSRTGSHFQRHILTGATGKADQRIIFDPLPDKTFGDPPFQVSALSVTVTTPLTGATLTLAPASAGPDVTGTPQKLQATLLDRNGSPVTNATVTFSVTGANPSTGTATTDTSGVASFSYTGTNDGTDTVQASATDGFVTVQSKTATVSWITPVQPVTTTTITGEFFAGGAGYFSHTPADKPAFTQSFPTIDFNPPGGTVPYAPASINVDTRPFTDVTTDVGGNYSGSVVAQGNGYQAGVGNLFSFDAVFTANFAIAKAGDITFNVYSDDGFIFGVGNGATRVNGANANMPATTPFQGYPTVGAYNQPTSPVANSVTVHFPAAGTYPYEIDYSECCGGQVALTVASSSTGHGVAPAGNLSLTPVNLSAQPVGQTVNLTVAAMDASGLPVANLPVTLNVSGPNSQQITGKTDATGLATLPYVGLNAGTDYAQVGAVVNGMPAVSNLVKVPWTLSSSGGSNNGPPPPAITNPSPADGSIVTKPVPVSATITPPQGQTITSWKVTYQALDPEAPVTLASGNGSPPSTLATFDPTLLPNDTYALTISATASGGAIQVITTTVAVSGNLKLGRYVTTYQDLSVPVNGFQMQVRRTYDSYDKRVGDFGVGWHVDLSNFRLSANRQLGAGGWTMYNTFCALALCLTAFRTSAPHFVTVTWPDGHQEIFDFTPTGGGTNVFPFGSGTAAFTARSGTNTTSTLQAQGDTSVSYQYDGNLYGSNGQPYNPQQFKLTTHDGRVLILDVHSGLVSETDPSGNALSVDATGVHFTLGPVSSPTPGPSITFTRDSQGRISDVYGPPAGQHLHYTYSSANELQTVTDPMGNTVTYTYDPQTGNLQKSLDPNNQPIQTLNYDPNTGRLVSIANGSQPATTVTSNIGAQQQTFADPNGKLTTALTYDDLGDVIQRDDSFNGKTLKTTYTYDSVGRVTSITDPVQNETNPAQATTSFVYDESATTSNGNLHSVTDALGRTWSFSNYNTLGEPGLIQKPDGTTLDTLTYDSTTGELLSDQQPGANPSTYTYWPNGEVKSVTDPGGRLVSFTYDSNGHLTSIADSQGRTVRLTPDASGQVTSVTDQLNNQTLFSYNPDGTLATMTDGNHNEWQYFYDSLGRLRQAEDPLLHSTYYLYNSLGELSQRTDRNGAITSYSYDVDGLLTQEDRPNNDIVNFAYDPLGRLIGAGDSSGQVDRAYDDSSRLQSETSCASTGSATTRCPTSAGSSSQPVVSLNYGYYADGRLHSVTGSDAGTIQYAYDEIGRLKTIIDPAQGSFGFGYNALGQLSSMTRPNSVDETLSYNASGDLTGRDNYLNGTLVSQFDYGIDPVTGRRTSETDLSGTSTFGYYANGELQSATHPAGSGLANESYTYDPAGNQTSWPGVSRATYDAGDRLQTDGMYNYVYDNEGDLLSKTPVGGGPGSTYRWDADHQLVGITYPNGTSSSYRYDPFGRRIAVVDPGQETRTVYDGLNPHADYDSLNQLQSSYLTGLGINSALEMISGGQTSYYLQDGLGSVRALTSSAGSVAGDYAYTAFGQPASGNAPASRFTFTGYQYDSASGLYYGGARYYGSSTGGFLSEDPLPAINRYDYAADDPTNLIDLLGAQAADEYANLVEKDAQTAEAAAEVGGEVAAADAEVCAGIAGAEEGSQVVASGSARVLGGYPTYVNVAKATGAKYFEVPQDIWNSMSPEEQWAANQRFLDRGINVGDSFLVVPNPGGKIGAGLAAEIEYLLSQGYQWSNNGLGLIPPC